MSGATLADVFGGIRNGVPEKSWKKVKKLETAAQN